MYNLLIVDDERLVADTLAETIPWSSISIEFIYKAYSAKEALHILNTQSIDVVITDIRMPEVNGLELIEQIRSFNKRTKCIIYSGHSSFEYARQAMASDVVEYLLKPADDGEILEAVKRMTERLNEEWRRVVSERKAAAALKEYSPLLRSTLLNDLIQGKKMSTSALGNRLKLLNLPFEPNDSVALLLIRLEEDFSDADPQSLALFEYAIGNIAEETMEEHFQLWIGKDHYGYLVILAKLNEHKAGQLNTLGSEAKRGAQQLLEQTSQKVQDNVRTFLQKKISLIVGHWVSFPDEINGLYQDCVNSIRQNVGNDVEVFLTLGEQTGAAPVQSLQSPYEPPTLTQLLDMGKREATLDKIRTMVQELNDHWRDSHEHLMEVFFHLSAAFAYAAHKNGRRLEELLEEEYEPLVWRKSFLSVNQLENWALHVAGKFFDDLDRKQLDNKAGIVQAVQNYVNAHLSEDVTLQTIADHVYLHPVYLSTIFKAETGNNLRDYIIRLKMEKAAYLLKHTNDRIYQICEAIGYQNPPYLIRVFKKHFGMTPQEYRDASKRL